MRRVCNQKNVYVRHVFRPLDSGNRLRSRFDGWRLRTSGNLDFNADSTATNTFSFAWFGSNQDNTGTWDFAPLDEMQESEPDRFEQWRTRLETDSNYHNQQLLMNQRHDIWENSCTDGTTYDPLRNQTYTATAGSASMFLRADGTWTVTSDLDRLQSTRKWYDRRQFRKIRYHLSKINKFLKLNRTAEEIQHEKAEKKSWELVKDWLTVEEFAELTSKGEMEIQSKEDLETIYIVKRDPIATVQEVKNGNYVRSMCVISKEIGLPTGDSLLSKIMLLKTDEKQFKKIAVVRNLA